MAAEQVRDLQCRQGTEELNSREDGLLSRQDPKSLLRQGDKMALWGQLVVVGIVRPAMLADFPSSNMFQQVVRSCQQ